MPLMMKLSSLSTLCSTWRVAGFFFSSLEQRRKVGLSLTRKVSTCTSPCGEDQRVPCAASRAFGTSLLGRPMRMPVAGSTTTLQPNSCSWLSAAAISAARCSAVSIAGDLGLVALLEIADGGFHRVVAGRSAGIVARPIERRLDLPPLGGGMPASSADGAARTLARRRPCGLCLGRRGLRRRLCGRHWSRASRGALRWRGLCSARCFLAAGAAVLDRIRIARSHPSAPARRSGAESEREQDDRRAATHRY